VLRPPSWNFYLPSNDVDPYDPTQQSRQAGRPTQSKVLRYKVVVRGQNLAGHDTTAVYHPGTPEDPYFFNSFIVQMPTPDYFQEGPVTVQIELCDCAKCEQEQGQGRCVLYEFPATFSRTAAYDASSSADRGRSR
jgi:hypothetical protein